MVSPLTCGPQLFADLNPNNYNVNSNEHNHIAAEKTENRPVASSIIGGGGHIFMYSCSAQLVSLDIDCFLLRTRMYEYVPAQLSS